MMKRSRAAAAALLVLVLLFLPSCGGRRFAEQMTVERKDGGIVLNGLEWGAKKEQVADAFGLAEGELLIGGFESVFSSQPASKSEDQEEEPVQFFSLCPSQKPVWEGGIYGNLPYAGAVCLWCGRPASIGAADPLDSL